MIECCIDSQTRVITIRNWADAWIYGRQQSGQSSLGIHSSAPRMTSRGYEERKSSLKVRQRIRKHEKPLSMKRDVVQRLNTQVDHEKSEAGKSQLVYTIIIQRTQSTTKDMGDVLCWLKTDGTKWVWSGRELVLWAACRSILNSSFIQTCHGTITVCW